MSAPNQRKRYVLITGCSQTSLGSAVALAFAAQPDWHVFATARSTSKLAHFSSLNNVTPLELEVTSMVSIAAAASKVSKQTSGLLDVLVNNAGKGHLGPLLDTPLDEFRDLMETNVVAPLAVAQAFAPMLVTAQGQILNMGSVMGYYSFVWQGPYSTSKSALRTLTNTLRHELSPLGVRVTHLTVGGTITKLHSAGYQVSKATTAPDSGSYYAPIASIIEHVGSEEELHKVCVPAEKVAQVIVENALRRGPKKELWTGGLAWVMWLFWVLGLSRVMEGMGGKRRGVPELERASKGNGTGKEPDESI